MTPVEYHHGVFVKRDDLCFPPPAPPFAKCRGIIKHLAKLKAEGVEYVGYTETSISMAGWGVAWACKELGLKAVIFDPQYVRTPQTLITHREQWAKFDPIIVPIKAGMAAVNVHIARKILKKNFNNSVMLPLGLPFEETMEETRTEAYETLMGMPDIKSVVTCVGSGTIYAGIYRGLNDVGRKITLYGILTRYGDLRQKQVKIQTKAKVFDFGFFESPVRIKLIDKGWEYSQRSYADCPFPCNPFYDLKAWEWLVNFKSITGPILFWNIGK
jgi:threonine dehydratase